MKTSHVSCRCVSRETRRKNIWTIPGESDHENMENKKPKNQWASVTLEAAALIDQAPHARRVSNPTVLLAVNSSVDVKFKAVSWMITLNRCMRENCDRLASVVLATGLMHLKRFYSTVSCFYHVDKAKVIRGKTFENTYCISPSNTQMKFGWSYEPDNFSGEQRISTK